MACRTRKLLCCLAIPLVVYLAWRCTNIHLGELRDESRHTSLKIGTTQAQHQRMQSSEDGSKMIARNLTYMSVDGKRPVRLPLTAAAIEHNGAFKPLPVLEKQSWVLELQMLLLKSNMKLIVLTTSTWECVTQLMRWLISARLIVSPPLDNILILSYDTLIHNLLLKRNFSTLYLNLSVIFEVPPISVKYGIFLSRLLVIQMINKWGINVFHCDSDAFLLKNPLELFEKYSNASIIASRGSFPFELGANGPWKYTACMGAILFRRTPFTDVFWMALDSINITSFDDQIRINYAIKKLNIVWTSKQWKEGDPNFAIGDGGFNLVVLPPVVICRETCTTSNQSGYYIWHSKNRLDFTEVLTPIVIENKTNSVGDYWLKSWSNTINQYFCNA